MKGSFPWRVKYTGSNQWRKGCATTRNAPPVMQALLRNLFDIGVSAVDPADCIRRYLPAPTGDRTLVVGAGKAVLGMLDGLVSGYGAPAAGVVVTPGVHGRPGGVLDPAVQVIEAAHPVPDAASIVAGQQILDLATRAGASDRLFVLLSGGASSLMECPLPPVTLADLQIVNKQLLTCGAAIDEINCVRKHLSAIKGGGLARAAAPAETLLFAISDVPGDGIADIGSGPCSVDATSPQAALEILRRYGLDAPATVIRLLSSSELHEVATDADSFAHVHSKIIARGQDALNAVAAAVEQQGFEPIILGTDIRCSSAELARRHAMLVEKYSSKHGRFALISGGETTVRVRNPDGRGGRNSAYLLNLALSLDRKKGVYALAADTDGIDGTEDNAGAVIGPESLDRAERAGLSARGLLDADTSYDFFAGLGDLVVTGPTGTNVNDLRIVLVARAAGSWGV